MIFLNEIVNGVLNILNSDAIDPLKIRIKISCFVKVLLNDAVGFEHCHKAVIEHRSVFRNIFIIPCLV